MKRILGKTAGGFTLAEAMLATVVLAIAAAGVLMPFVAGASVRAEGQRRTLAAKLGADLMEKIVNTDPNEIVTTWDGYNEDQGDVTDMTGTVFADPVYANYSRDANCVDVYVGSESGDDTPIFIRTTVNIYYRGRSVGSVSRLIAQ